MRLAEMIHGFQNSLSSAYAPEGWSPLFNARPFWYKPPLEWEAAAPATLRRGRRYGKFAAN